MSAETDDQTIDTWEIFEWSARRLGGVSVIAVMSVHLNHVGTPPQNLSGYVLKRHTEIHVYLQIYIYILAS